MTINPLSLYATQAESLGLLAVVMSDYTQREANPIIPNGRFRAAIALVLNEGVQHLCEEIRSIPDVPRNVRLAYMKASSLCLTLADAVIDVYPKEVPEFEELAINAEAAVSALADVLASIS